MYLTEVPLFMWHKTRICLKRLLDLLLFLVFQLMLFFQPKQVLDKNEIKQILLINLQGIGDLVMTTPFIDALKKAYPYAQVHYLCYGKNGDILAADKRVDVIHSYTGGFLDTAFFQQLSKIRSQQYDLCVNLFPSQHSAFLTIFSQAKYIVGTLYSLQITRNFTLASVEETVFQQQQQKTRNLRKQCQYLALSLGCFVQQYDRLSLVVDPQLQKKIKALHIEPFQKAALRIVINPCSTWQTKQWETERWQQLLLALAKKYSKKKPIFYFIGSSNDTALVQRIVASLSSAHLKSLSFVNLAGKLSLQELLAFFSFMDLMITADGGPMHIAAGLQIPTIALFGVTQPALLVSENKLFKAIKKPSLHKHLFGSCYDFHNQPLQSCHVMMLNITVDDVMTAVNELGV